MCIYIYISVCVCVRAFPEHLFIWLVSYSVLSFHVSRYITSFLSDHFFQITYILAIY